MSSNIQPLDISLLSRYFDPLIFDSLQLLSIKGIEWQRLTIVFWDISGFSKVCKKVKDERFAIEPFLTEYFKTASNLISQKGGVLDKFMGDGILAYFGFPIDKDEIPSKAIEVALELRNTFKGIKERYERIWQKRYGEILNVDLRCGIHTGSVYFGQIPAGNRNQITVFGTEVNLASRLEKVAKGDQIIITEQVKNMVDDTFDFETIELKELIKDYEEIKYVYRVIGKKNLQLDQNRVGGKNEDISFRILNFEDLKQMGSLGFQLSQKYCKLFRFNDISINKLGKYVYAIDIKINATITKGFFNIMIIRSDGEKDWVPYNSTFDTAKYTGNLELNNEKFDMDLILDLTKYSEERVRPFILIYEDSDGNTSRKLVAGFEVLFGAS